MIANHNYPLDHLIRKIIKGISYSNFIIIGSGVTKTLIQNSILNGRSQFISLSEFESIKSDRLTIEISSKTVIILDNNALVSNEIKSFINKLVSELNVKVITICENAERLDVCVASMLGNSNLITKDAISDIRLSRYQVDKAARAMGLKKIRSMQQTFTIEDLGAQAQLIALSRHSSLGELIFDVVSKSNPCYNVSHFLDVWDKSDVICSELDGQIIDRRFLTIIVRTQGLRNHTLPDTLLSLFAQDCDDFEILIAKHRVKNEHALAVNEIIDSFGPFFPGRLHSIDVEQGSRSSPLNAGFEAAEGNYIVYLDDDDIVFSDYVSTFYSLARQNPGSILRSVAVVQKSEVTQIADFPGIAAIGPMEKRYSSDFDLFVHLRMNQSPFMTVAFPRGVFHNFGMRFDENLTTTEDYDFIIRSAALCGVASSDNITSIYRWWQISESSRTLHSPAEWDNNLYKIHAKFDALPIIYPKGTSARIRYLLNAYDAANQNRDRIFKESLVVLKNLSQSILHHMKGNEGFSWRDLFKSLRSGKLEVAPWTDEQLISASGLFDATWYLNRYPDVRDAKIDPLKHFIASGGLEGRSPSQKFDSEAYFRSNPEVFDMKINPLIHYLTIGIYKGQMVVHVQS